MSVRPSAQDATTRWVTGTQSAGPRYTAGITNANNWAENSLAAAPARNAGLIAATQDGRIDRGIQSLGTTGWKNKTLAKGPTNWTTAVTAPGAQAAMLTGMNKLYGYLDQADSAIASMPRGGYADNKARMNTYIDTVHNAAQAAK